MVMVHILQELPVLLRIILWESLEFLGPDELAEITPQSIRLRKKLLTAEERGKARKRAG